ncbi:Hypp9195 [Branchiostoma lanceolatum]|uniref:Hypp9195 protein n=1 Tax=Branchiostoma lanceolatum TaxID=7740 RepID=A0A8K0EHT9_BRALA|nr:Hypp9195 [Branchiostoma lanceolatum]
MVLEFLPGTGDYTTMPMKLARAVPRLVRDSRLMKYGRPKIWRAGEVWPVVAMVTIGGAMLGMAFRTKSYVGNQGHRDYYKHNGTDE